MDFSLKGKSILVTGGAGFIGSHLADRLIDEDPKAVIVIDNFFLGKVKNLSVAMEKGKEVFQYYALDVTNARDVAEIVYRHQIDVVFHLAVIPLPHSLQEPGENVSQNIEMTLVLCELAKQKAFTTLVHFSSSEAYGTARTPKMIEEHDLLPETPYAASKAACDLIVRSYQRSFGIDATIVRPFNNYGPRQNEGLYAGVIPITIRTLLNGDHPIIYGTGRQTRDFTYVSDTVGAAIQLYKTKESRGRVINVGSGVETPIQYLVGTICNKLDYDGHIRYEARRDGDVDRHCADTLRLRQMTGFKPTVSFDEGITKTVEWYKENHNE